MTLRILNYPARHILTILRDAAAEGVPVSASASNRRQRILRRRAPPPGGGIVKKSPVRNAKPKVRAQLILNLRHSEFRALKYWQRRWFTKGNIADAAHCIAMLALLRPAEVDSWFQNW